jgi:leucyl aminopeptidase
MTTATLSILPSSSAAAAGDVLVVAAVRSGDGHVIVRSSADLALSDALDAVGFRGKKDEVVRLPAPAGLVVASLAVVGLGRGEIGADALRYAAGVAVRRVPGAPGIVLDFAPGTPAEVEAIAEGAGIGAYEFTDYRGAGREEPDRPVRTVSIVADIDGASGALDRAVIASAAVNRVRDLVNVPALDLYPEVYAEQVVALAEGRPLEVTVWDYESLVREGFGGIVGVGRGSVRLPRLVRVDYSPAGAERHIALIGKGITFDTGGLSLKSPISMIGMKYDMAGSATVLATVVAAAELELPIRITAWLCLAENMPSGDAIRPGDVLTIRGGRTVEVLNTDAEGRLVLADGLVAAGEEHPDAIIDVATLTGAAIVALGSRYVGTMGDPQLVSRVLAAAAEAGETLWHMPLPEELRPMLASDIADIANAKPGNTAGGMLLAATFLKEFVPAAPDGDPIPWVHLDIAGAAQNKESGYGYTVKGPTGVTVRTLLRFAEAYSRA